MFWWSRGEVKAIYGKGWRTRTTVKSAGNFAREKAETYNHAGTELRNLIGDWQKRCGVGER